MALCTSRASTSCYVHLLYKNVLTVHSFSIYCLDYGTSVNFMSVLVPRFTWSFGTLIVSFHLFLSRGMFFASGHVLNPISHLAF